MSDYIKIIKASKLNKNDNTPIGAIININNTNDIPKSFIQYIPNRIFDRRKYYELYKLFNKDHLPTEHEITLYQYKLFNERKIKHIPKDMLKPKKHLIKKFILDFLKVLCLPIKFIYWLFF